MAASPDSFIPRRILRLEQKGTKSEVAVRPRGPKRQRRPRRARERKEKRKREKGERRNGEERKQNKNRGALWPSVFCSIRVYERWTLTGKISYSSIFLRRTNSRSLITFHLHKAPRPTAAPVAYSALSRVLIYICLYIDSCNLAL